MKACACCAMESADDVATCPLCGEASWTDAVILAPSADDAAADDAAADGDAPLLGRKKGRR